MSKFRISATGKLYHLIQLSQERISIIPTAKKQKIQDSYQLEKPSPETIKMMGTQASELAKPNKISFRLKIILKESVAYLIGVALAAWNDPENQELTQDWQEIRIMLVRTTDPLAKLPPRFCGEMNLDLNSSYLSKGMETEEGTVWFKYLTQMPDWATEKKDVLLRGARWVEKEGFETITRNIIRMEKEIKLEDRNKRPSDGKQGSRNIFPDEQDVLFCMFNKDAREFTLKKLADLKREAKREQKRPEFDRSSKPVDPVYERQKREWDSVKATSVKNTSEMHSREEYDKLERNVSNTGNMNPREEHCNFVRNLGNATEQMQQAQIGPNYRYINQTKCMFKDAHNQCELLVPQPRGNFQKNKSVTDLLNTEVPHELGTTEALLLPRSPIKWPNHPLHDEDIHLENERRRLEEFKIKKTGKKVTFGQPTKGTHNAEVEEVETDPAEQHDYEEIPENDEPEPDHEPDMTTPRSRLRAPVPVRQLRPNRVVLNYTTDQLPGAFFFPPTTQPRFNFPETPTPLSITRQVQDEEQELGVSGEEGWERQVQDEEQELGESGEEGWESENEDEEQVENNEELDWRRRLLGPNSPSMTTSYETEKEELKILIDRELQLVHNLEEQINNSTILEGIYRNNKCSLIYQPNIITVNTNPDLLSDSPQERVKIMQGLYEQIIKAKEDRVTVLERLAKAENVRRSKRLLRKPKKKYYDH